MQWLYFKIVLLKAKSNINKTVISIVKKRIQNTNFLSLRYYLRTLPAIFFIFG